ncbi:MAG: FMN-binding protein [Pseudomonadota bacterium]|nr:FMN-binding protein [Pseudomonadota bacterium]
MLIFLIACVIPIADADDQVYLAPDAFLAEAFGTTPQPSILWITAEIQPEVEKILGHPPPRLRQRYWKDGAKTAWILEEIGKEEFITAGFVVANDRIERARVLIYRESRGMEVRYPAFLRQFDGVQLLEQRRLSKRIDGIAGATLSVWAMERMARSALYFHRHVQK